jgi:bifunctional UDP-N-acetylglucosamine pyrophosphorylase/glucosamine-1-phosphate N-acetyltransferase
MGSALPKVLHPVDGRPMLLRVLDAVAGLRPRPDPVVVVIGHGAPEVRAALAGSPLPVEVALQERQLGTGHALRQAEDLVRGRAQTTLVLYGDTPLLASATLQRLLLARLSSSATLALITTVVAHPDGYGRIVRNGTGQVARIVEHRDARARERAIREINAGIYAYDDGWLWPALRSLRPSPGGEIYLTGLVASAIGEGRQVVAVRTEPSDEVLGVNTPAELAGAERALRERAGRQRGGRDGRAGSDSGRGEHAAPDGASP